MRDDDKTLDVLRDATRGTVYEGRLYCVGGYVRDKVMGIGAATGDVDIVLEGDALALAHFLFEHGASEITPVVYPRFGTAMVKIAGRDVELVTARTESYAPDSRKPDQVRPGTIAEDARRRDFTINTLIENMHTGDLADPTGCGMRDLRDGLIRTPTEPSMTFIDDPLRMLRAVRFAARFGFRIEDATWQAILSAAPRLDIISRERVRDEFCKTLLTDRPALGIDLMRVSGLLARFAPELLEMVGVEQNAFHAYPVWEHTLAALSALESNASLEVRLAMLLHDSGKPRTRSVNPAGAVHFYQHEDVSAAIARELLGRLRCSNDQIDAVVALVANHMRIGEYGPGWTDAAVRRLIRDLGGRLDDLFLIHAADVAALAPEHQGMQTARELRERIDRIVSRQDITSLRSPLDGGRIMDVLNISPGTRVRMAKEFLTTEVVEGRLQPDDIQGATRLLIERFGEETQTREA
ncbi:MAG: CCA tRNA nucleotidyltransferase [Capsulimonadaceae bacterium]